VQAIYNETQAPAKSPKGFFSSLPRRKAPAASGGGRIFLRMKTPPRTGLNGQLTFVVTAQHAIDFAGGGMPAVLSTPWLVWFLEHAAREAMLPLLEPGESTVGVRVDIEHLAPTPLGDQVTCLARVLHSDGPVVSFQLEARDRREVIARGFHKLRVIRIERFAARVAAKSAGT
jgi:fluoroacetyl-CoA thioesterase